MDKDLPNIYKGVVNNSNNQDSSILKEEVKKEVKKEVRTNKDIENDIKKIFTSKDFIYRADVLITLKDNSKLKKTIIGTNNNSLITIDDELIDINNISQIDLI
jgi:hypothetical protein